MELHESTGRDHPMTNRARRSAAGIAVAIMASLGSATDSAADPWDRATQNDDSTGTQSELVHGSEETHDLKTKAGVPDEDWYRLSQKPYSSYEIVVDATSGDITPVALDRILNNGIDVQQSATPIGVGHAMSLRWQNSTASTRNGHFIRVKSGGCTDACEATDVYRIRAFDTTYAVSRINNAGTQVTVLLLQNPTDYTIAGDVRFFNALGTLIGSSAFSLAAKAELVLNTSIVPGVGGTSGSATIANDGRYGDLFGKAVALEPATGFSFDTPIEPRPH
jgi:hypothetical protein